MTKKSSLLVPALASAVWLAAGALGVPAPASAQVASPALPLNAPPPVAPGQAGAASPGVEYKGKGESVTAHGRHSLPPGYQEAPQVEFRHGPDPDHEAGIQRDPTTGTDLTRFGSTYQAANPTQSGQVGDSTGWGVAPRN